MPTQLQPAITYLKDYQISNFLIDTVHLEIELNPTDTQVNSILVVKRNPKSTDQTAPLVLHGEQIILQSVQLNTQVLTANAYELTADTLTIPTALNEFTLKITTTCAPANNTALSGLYISGDTYCTQCEPHGFRRITYYIDRPDVLARFTTKIIAGSEKSTLLANGNLLEAGKLVNGKHYAIWQDPFPKPSYLYALVAGNFECLEDCFTTMSNRRVTLKIYVERGRLQQAHHAMWSLKAAMAWDESHYGREYDLDIFMIVAVRDFNFGAMENKGLNIFNEKYVLADPRTATDQDYEAIAAVVAHEYFHNWSGNRVTCRDWFQLSLKEGLTVFRDQSFSEDHFGQAVARIDQVNHLRSAQFAEDAGPMAHPVRPDSFVEINNFYTMTIYEKGAEVIRMQREILGADRYRCATDLYFKRYDGMAVTCDDFVSCMAEVGEIDLTQFKHWYTYAGTPVLSVTAEYDAKQAIYTLIIKQACPPTPKQPEKPAFLIPVKLGLISLRTGAALPIQLMGETESELEKVLLVNAAEQCYQFVNVQEPVLPSLLRGFSAPVKLNFAYSDSDYRWLMQHDTDGFNRFEAGYQYATAQLLRLMQAQQTQQPLQLPNEFIAAYAALFQQTNLSPELLANLLTLPSTQYLAERMTEIDPVAIYNARQFMKKTLAQQLKAELLACLQLSELTAVYAFDEKGRGQRALRAVAFNYLCSTGDATLLQHCATALAQANNMSDRMNLLTALNQCDSLLRSEALANFYQAWQREPLVIDKWLRLQASAELETTLETVTSLLQHPAFNLKNPNNVYSLLGAFGGNLTQFHRADGRGYVLLTDQIILLNRLNPQVAARVIMPLTKWRQYNKARQALIKQQLTRLAELPDLSKDLYEIVDKALGSS